MSRVVFAHRGYPDAWAKTECASPEVPRLESSLCCIPDLRTLPADAVEPDSAVHSQRRQRTTAGAGLRDHLPESHTDDKHACRKAFRQAESVRSLTVVRCTASPPFCDVHS